MGARVTAWVRVPRSFKLRGIMRWLWRLRAKHLPHRLKRRLLRLLRFVTQVSMLNAFLLFYVTASAFRCFCAYTGCAAFHARYEALSSEIASLCEKKHASLGTAVNAADDMLEEITAISSLISAATVQLCDVDVAAHAQSLEHKIHVAVASLRDRSTSASSPDETLVLAADLSPILADIARLGMLQ